MMNAVLPVSEASTEPPRVARVDVIIPAYNEQHDLARSVVRLNAFLEETFPYDFQVVIADNASTDATWEIAQRLAAAHPHIRVVRLEAKGRGRALRQVWLESDADVVAYMDVDLSTDLKALLPLVAPLVSGHSDIAIGSRLSHGSRVVRGAKREFISRSYNLILKASLGAGFSDAQCGFKALRRDVADQLLPLVEDNNWFFDTELLVLAERVGLRIHEVPVDWIDDPGSTVDITATALEDLRGVWRLLRRFATGRIALDRVRAALAREGDAAAVAGVPRGMVAQLLRFATVGVVSTLAYFVLYLLMRPLGAQVANLAALLLTAVLNTAANRRFTFGIAGRKDVVKHQIGGLVAFGLALGLTSGSLWLLARFWPDADHGIELAVLVVANAAATLLRFVSLRMLMHHRRDR